jgi:virginiamycin B lyase
MGRQALIVVGALAVLLLAVSSTAAAPRGRAPTGLLTASRGAVVGEIKEWKIPSTGVPEGIALGSDGALWFSERYTSQIGRMTRRGAFKIYSLDSVQHMTTDITAGPDGALWFTFPNNAPPFDSGRIGRITTAGNVTLYPIPGTTDAESITAGPDGNLWFADHVGAAVWRMTTGGAARKFAIPGPSGTYPYEITAGPDGALWFTDFNGRRIGRITTAGQVTFYPLGSQDGLPDSIATGPDGKLWFTLDQTGRIGRITTSGAIDEFTIDHPPSDYVFLSGIAAGPDGALWFTYQDYTSGASKVGRITTSGKITTFPTPTQQSSPHAITARGAGTMFFTEAAQRIGRIKTG